MGRDHLGWSESGPDSVMEGLDVQGRRQHGAMRRQNSANGIYIILTWDIHGFKNPVSLRPTSSNAVKNYLHQVILWHNSAYKDKAASGPLSRREPSYENGGSWI